MIKPIHDARTPLLVTVTGEPFQPVRLYYAVPSRRVATKALETLRCIDKDERAKCWVWLYVDEAASLTFERARKDLPAGVHPIVIGRFRFPDKNFMALEVRSVPRAIEAAKFFAPILGPSIVLTRLRVINRWFKVEEATAGLDRLDKLLDANVVRVNPKDAEDALVQAMAGTRTQEEKLAAFWAHMETVRRKDVPLVEDFPLIPEEETPEFQDLTLTLRFRTIRAFEHWQGNTGITLADVIQRVVKQTKGGEQRLDG